MSYACLFVLVFEFVIFSVGIDAGHFSDECTKNYPFTISMQPHTDGNPNKFQFHWTFTNLPELHYLYSVLFAFCYQFRSLILLNCVQKILYLWMMCVQHIVFFLEPKSNWEITFFNSLIKILSFSCTDSFNGND